MAELDSVAKAQQNAAVSLSLLRPGLYALSVLGLLACAPQRSMPKAAAPSRSQPPSPPAPVREAPLILADVALPEQPARSFQIQVERCFDSSGCPFQVVLREGERVVAQSTLDWAKAVSAPAFRPIEPEWGIGDPFDTRPVEAEAAAPPAEPQATQAAPVEAPQLTAAITGDGSTFVATIARPVALGSAVAGLLVDQVTGPEPIKRAHHVLVARGDRLELAYSQEDEEGPSWSRTVVLSIESAREGIALFHGMRLAGVEPGEADAVESQLVAWSVLDRKLRVSPLEGALHAVIVGPLKSLDSALALRDRHAECLGEFSVISAASLPEARLKGTLLVQYGASADGAQRVLDNARRCVPKTQTRTLAFD